MAILYTEPCFSTKMQRTYFSTVKFQVGIPKKSTYDAFSVNGFALRGYPIKQFLHIAFFKTIRYDANSQILSAVTGFQH